MRTIDQARANLEASIAYIPQRYAQGVQGADWATRAGSDAAETAWAQNTAAAAARKARQAGIRAAGNEKWRQGALTKGAANIANGVRNGLTKYQTNFGPVLSAMQNAVTTLPPRSSDPMANIQNRLVPVMKAAIAASPKRK